MMTRNFTEMGQDIEEVEASDSDLSIVLDDDDDYSEEGYGVPSGMPEAVRLGLQKVQMQSQAIINKLKASRGGMPVKVPMPLNRRNVARLIGKRSDKKIIATPTGVAQLKAVTAIHGLIHNNDFSYTRVKYGIRTVTDRASSFLRPAECSALKNLLFSGSAADPLVRSMTQTGPNSVGYGACQTESGIQFMPDGANWVGVILTFEASDLNQVRELEVTVRGYSRAYDVTGALPCVTETFVMSKKHAKMEVAFLMSKNVGGTARLISAPTAVSSDSNPSNSLCRIEVSGIPGTSAGTLLYGVKIRAIVPGEAKAENMIKVL